MKYLRLFLYLVLMSSIFSQLAEPMNHLPLELSKNTWFAVEGFEKHYITHSENMDAKEIFGDKQIKVIKKFPIILSSVFNIQFSTTGIKEYSLISFFSLDFNRIEKGKELAFLFSRVGESWSVLFKWGINSR